MAQAVAYPQQKPLTAAVGIALAADQVRALLEHATARLSGMIQDRMSFWTHWQELAKYLLPRRYKWLITPNQANRGSPINQAIIDNTGTISQRTLAAGMMGGITSPGRPWLRFTIDDLELRELPEVKLWLDEVTRRILTVFAESNFYMALATMYQDLGCFGTHAMVIREDFDDVIRCYNFALGEYCLANNARMEADTCYRQFVMTTCQLVEEFGFENCSADVQSLYNQRGAGLTQEVILCHAIEPNRGITDKSGPLARFPYREVYWEWGKQSDKVLRVSGLHEEALIAPRWDIVGNDAYGRSPGMDALGDVKQLQVEQKRKGQAIDKLVNQPLVGDMSLKNEPASLLPGGLTYVNLSTDRPGLRPVYEVRPQLAEMVQDIEDCRTRIRAAFFYELFMMLATMEGKQPRNDLEILERKEEKMIQLGPVLERFENEALDKAVNRTFSVMMRKGLLPQPPDAMRGHFVKPEYISILAVAQKAAMTAGLERFASFVGRIAAGQAGVQGVGPEAMDNVDWDEMCQEYADMLGVPEKVVRPMVDVLKSRAARAKQQAAAAALETGSVMVDGAKTLSETDVGGGINALQMMVQ